MQQVELTEQGLLAWGADLCNRFRTLPEGDADADILQGSAMFAHSRYYGGAKAAAHQLRRIKALAPKLILEIGTARAVTTVRLAALCETVITIDIGPYGLRADVIDWAGANNAILTVVPNNDHKSRLVNFLDFQVAFVDGDHSEEGCAFDFEIVKKCGRVLVHDFTPTYPNGPLALIASLPRENVIEEAPFAWWFASVEECERMRAIE